MRQVVERRHEKLRRRIIFFAAPATWIGSVVLELDTESAAVPGFATGDTAPGQVAAMRQVVEHHREKLRVGG